MHLNVMSRIGCNGIGEILDKPRVMTHIDRELRDDARAAFCHQ